MKPTNTNPQKKKKQPSNGDRETYIQVRDVIDRLREAHQELRDALERPRSSSSDSRSQFILEALRKSEQELQLVLARYQKDGDKELLDTWLQYVHDDDLFRELNSIEFKPNMPPDLIVSRKLEFDQRLLALLQQLARETSVPRVEEFFSTLANNFESRIQKQAWKVSEYQADGDPPAAR